MKLPKRNSQDAQVGAKEARAEARAEELKLRSARRSVQVGAKEARAEARAEELKRLELKLELKMPKHSSWSEGS